MEILTAEQKLILDSLKNPNAPSIKEVQYDFDKSVQQDVLSLMIYERSFMIQAMHLIKSYYFVDKAHVLICKILMEWFEKHIKGVSGQEEQWIQDKYIRDQLNEHLKDNVTKSYYLAEFQTILDSYVQGLTSRGYCLERITNFAKDQEIRLAITRTIDLLKDRDTNTRYEKIKVVWDKALIVGPQMDLGLSYFEDIEERYKRMVQDRSGKDRFSAGFADIDEGIVGRGLSRGEIGGYQANSGVGKSWALCKAALENVRRGHKVLHLTLEMNQDKTAERFDTLYTGINMNDLLAQSDFVKKKLQAEIKVALANLEENADRRRLIIKHFAAGTSDVATIKAFYSQLSVHGFKPDLLIVDYIGEFRDIPGMKTYESRQRLMRDLRTFGVEENHCTLTAMQSNRSGRFAQDGGFIDDSEIGDSYGQVRVMDAVWSINQSKREKAANVGRIFVIKNRNGKSRYHFHYRQDPIRLNMEVISEDNYKDAISSVKELNADTRVAEELNSDNRFTPNRGGERYENY